MFGRLVYSCILDGEKRRQIVRIGETPCVIVYYN